jgi:hypothetical protein
MEDENIQSLNKLCPNSGQERTMSKISVRSVPAALFAGLVLAACGGGGDDGTRIPAGVKVCELKEVPSHTYYSAASMSDISGVNGLIPGLANSVFLLTPMLVVSEDMIFTVTAPNAYLPPQPEARRYVFYVTEFLYPRSGARANYQCVVTGLRSDEKVYISGGESDYPRRFYVSAWATLVLDDGRVVASEETSLVIER